MFVQNKRLINDKERPLIDKSELKRSLEKIYYERKNLYKNCANFTSETIKTAIWFVFTSSRLTHGKEFILLSIS